MTLSYVAFSEIPSDRANAIQVLRMCEAFAKLVEDVELHCRKGWKTTEELSSFYAIEKSFAIHRRSVPRIRVLDRIWYALTVLVALARRRNQTIVYSRDPFTSLAICWFSPRVSKLILEAHAPPHSEFWRRWHGRLFQHRKFSHLVAISTALSDEFMRLYPKLAPEQVIVAHDGAREAVSVGQPGVSAELRKRASVGYVGSLRPGKGMEIIHALAPLLPQCDFHVVGGDEGSVRRWKERTNSTNVTFHGFMSPAEAQRRISGFDVVLAPYQPEVLVGNDDLDIARWMSPLKLFEYMSHGKPIVASDLPVLREILKDGNNALLADPVDIADWCRKVLQLTGDAALRARIGTAALRDFRDNYTWDRRAAIILERAGVRMAIQQRLDLRRSTTRSRADV